MEAKLYKKTSSYFIYGLIAILVVILMFNLIIVYKSYKYPDKIPDLFGYKPFIVMSGSMEPAIYEGDLVIIKNIEVGTLKVDDIIAYRNESDKVVTHRITKVITENEKIKFETKGDYNSNVDSTLIDEEKVEGIYIDRIAKIGDFLIFMNDPIKVCMIIFVIILIFLINYVIAFNKEKKKLIENNKRLLEELSKREREVKK